VQQTGPLVVEAIAEASSCGVSRIRAILANLVDVGALARAPQWNPAGGRPTYLYYDPASPAHVALVQARTARPGRSA
jgi:predicted transcriptional regulator